VFLNRGNHEADLKQGFVRELHDRFPGEAVIRAFVFSRQCNSTAVADGGTGKAFVVHGGMPVSGSQPVKLEETMQINRQLDPPRDTDHLVTQVLWNDPHRGSSDEASEIDGYGQKFDCNDTRAFLNANDFRVVLRTARRP
jgi:hypothetical protein